MDAFFPGADGDRPPFLADADEHDWELLRRHAAGRRYPAGAVVVPRGDTDRSLLLLVEGTLAQGAGRRAATVAPGSVLGELAFLAGRPAAHEVRAVTDAEVLRLDLVRFEALAAADAALGRYLLFDLARLLAERAEDLRALTGRRR